MQTKGLFFFLLLFVLSSCVSNTINVKPDAEEYLQLANTPVYVKRSSDTDLYAFENELDECIKTSNNRANRSSKAGIGFGKMNFILGQGPFFRVCSRFFEAKFPKTLHF